MTTYRNITRIVLFTELFLSQVLLGAQMAEVKQPAFHAPHQLGKIALLHDESEFYVLQNGTHHKVQNCWVDKALRNISTKHLAALLAGGYYIIVNQMSDGEFSLKANSRILGGGPGLAQIGYWTTKAVGYGTLAATAVVVDSATQGLATPVLVGAAAQSSAVVEAISAAIWTLLLYLPTP